MNNFRCPQNILPPSTSQQVVGQCGWKEYIVHCNKGKIQHFCLNKTAKLKPLTQCNADTFLWDLAKKKTKKLSCTWFKTQKHKNAFMNKLKKFV